MRHGARDDRSSQLWKCARCAVLAALAAGCQGAASAAASAHAEGVGHDVLVYEQGKGERRDLYVVPAAGGPPRRLTTDPATDGLPRWTSDGSAVVFTSNRSGHWQLWRVAAKGGKPVPVRVNPHTEWQADESPDGRVLAFLSDRDGRESLWLLDQVSREMRALVRHGKRTTMGNPDWGPDGALIVFSSNWQNGHQIYVVDAGDGRARRISPKGGCEPRFSPDGTKVVYVHRRPREDRSRSAIVEHDLASGEETVLVDWPALSYDPVYSPDGSQIAFASNVTGTWEIYRQRLADGKAQRVTFANADARYPDYRPSRRQR